MGSVYMLRPSTSSGGRSTRSGPASSSGHDITDICNQKSCGPRSRLSACTSGRLRPRSQPEAVAPQRRRRVARLRRMRLWLKDCERRPDPAPVKSDDRKAMLVGLVLWLLALVGLLLFLAPLVAGAGGGGYGPSSSGSASGSSCSSSPTGAGIPASCSSERGVTDRSRSRHRGRRRGRRPGRRRPRRGHRHRSWSSRLAELPLRRPSRLCTLRAARSTGPTRGRGAPRHRAQFRFEHRRL